jgi:hypothetical protein
MENKIPEIDKISQIDLLGFWNRRIENLVKETEILLTLEINCKISI